VADSSSLPVHEETGDSVAVPPDVARFVLVRHGETQYNHQGRWQGAESDPPLNDRGREQASELATSLGSIPFDALYSSDLDRALETARILGAQRGLQPRVLAGLREMSHGAWEGKTLSEILEAWAEEYAAFESDPRSVSRPGGDSYSDLAARIWPLLDRLADRHRGERVLVVTHGGPIRLVLSDLKGVPLTERQKLGVDNGSWFVIEKAADGWRVAQSP
jgi:broad specificity phosphatase PhoE